MNKQGSEMRDTPNTGTEPESTEKDQGEGREQKKRFDLSVPQVAGSAFAAVLAAKLASTLGVYGTIIGAGVISVVATCGGPVLQHVFKRTGEQMRRPRPAATPLPAPGPAATPTLTPTATPTPTPTAVLVPPSLPDPVATAPYGHMPDEEFGTPTTHGTRMRGWKRPALGAAAVFALAMGGITTYELTSGQDLGGTKGRTTFGSVVRGDGGARDGHGSENGGNGGNGGSGENGEPGGSGQGDGTGPQDQGGQGGAGQDRPSPSGTAGTGTPTPAPDRNTGTPAPGDTTGTDTGTGTGTGTPSPAPGGGTTPGSGSDPAPTAPAETGGLTPPSTPPAPASVNPEVPNGE
ncbi:hypothetical protein ACGFRB_13060 [Streptomyces sp. NPDC048718]|uniref:hypothetical protein n=1 Tax=Streptomyces sp. NPDC048718 TaxID=3365587 RepID=UPI0037187696